MNALNEVQEILSQSEEKIEGLLQRLESQKSIEELLEESRNGVAMAGESVARFAEEARVTMKGLQDVLHACQGTLEILQRSNPERVLEAVEKNGDRLEHAEQNILGRVNRAIYVGVATCLGCACGGSGGVVCLSLTVFGQTSCRWGLSCRRRWRRGRLDEGDSGRHVYRLREGK